MFAADTWERVVFHDSWHRFLHHASLAAYHASQASAKQIEDRALFKIAAAFYDEMFAPDQPTITPIPVGVFSLCPDEAGISICCVLRTAFSCMPLISRLHHVTLDVHNQANTAAPASFTAHCPS